MPRGRETRPAAQPPSPGLEQPAPHHATHKPRRLSWVTRELRYSVFIVMVGSALILSALALWIALSPSRGEDNLIDHGKYQAVFLNGGITSGSVLYSTYFGRLTTLNNKYLILNDVYYLTADQQTQGGTPQLTKLGCQQLHSPDDQMVVNRSQLAFWENIKDDGKVVAAIKEYKKQNPKGPNCAAASQPSGQTNTSPQNTTPGNSTTNKVP